MSKTKTLPERFRDATLAYEEAVRAIERLTQEQRALAPEALVGEAGAKEEIAKLEKQEAEAKRRKALAETALEELAGREEEERRAVEDQRREELSSRYDELACGRKKLLASVERALDALDKKASALLEHDREQRAVAEDMGYQHGQGPYGYILRNRILFRLGNFLGGVPGAASSRRTPLTEGDWFTRTIAEEQAAKEKSLRQAEERRAEDERIREASERAEQIRNRRYELQAGLGYADAMPQARAEIEKRVEKWLAQEFGEETD